MRAVLQRFHTRLDSMRAVERHDKRSTATHSAGGRTAGPSIFTEDLELVSIDGNAQPAQAPGVTHSGFVTVVREITGNDNFFPNDDSLFQYEATYLFDTATANLPAALPRGVLTAAGVSRFPKPATITFAITGGTGPTAWLVGRLLSRDKTALSARLTSPCDRA
jgi:hypothetical protein